MKYVKTFNELIVEKINPIEEGNHNLKSILINIFRIFKTKDDLAEIFDNEDELIIATDLYDSFIDTYDIIELSHDELQSFADNLGVGGELDVLVAIMEKMYKDKFKRNMKDDVNSSIETLKEFIMTEESTEKYKVLSKKYLTELEKIKDNL
jgi:hypothetical protein